MARTSQAKQTFVNKMILRIIPKEDTIIHMKKNYLGVALGVLIAFGVLALAFIYLRPQKDSKKVAPPLAQPTQSATSQTVAPPTGQVIIRLTTNGFYPAKTTIKSNTRLIWVNDTDKKATVNADDHPTHTKYPLLNLGEFDKGQAVQTVLKEKGTYTYHNHLAPSVKGTIVVE